MKPILRHLNEKLQIFYTPQYYVSLMIWKSHLTWKVYVPSKHACFSINSFELCQFKSGYVWNFIVNVGKETVFDENIKG
jgi:hypothetical protein